jgi:methylphosphotriester-DNA--protein-cysteine methyltransferase
MQKGGFMKKRSLLLAIATMIAIAGYAATGETTVYITKTGEKYHAEHCASVRKSKIAIRLDQAVSRGYEPCKRCKPPVLD